MPDDYLATTQTTGTVEVGGCVTTAGTLLSRRRLNYVRAPCERWRHASCSHASVDPAAVLCGGVVEPGCPP